MKKIISIFCTLSVSLMTPMSLISCTKNEDTFNHESSKDHKKHKGSKVNRNNKVEQYIEEMEENLISDQLEKKGIDGSNLSINNTLQDAMDLIYEKILMDDPEVENIDLKKGKLTDFLVEGTNTIKVEYQVHKQKK